ncbi:MAG: hypothetical protein R3C14_26110 [Caldilineaceae bacterium]
MIVLDEQLMGRNLEIEIAHWYRGAVCFITDLRPATVIKDDGIPTLLQQQNQPTFVTINEIDFWRKVRVNRRYCIVCFTLSDARANELPARLRQLVNHPLFTTKEQRMGKAIRVTEHEISYYTFTSRTVQSIHL